LNPDPDRFLDDPGVALMLAFRDGDDEAFTRLVELYQGPVFGMLRRILGPRGSVEDLAQETFLRVWRSRDGYRPTGKFTTFLYRITYNLALNRLRDEGRRPVRPLPEGAEEGLADGASPDPVEAADRGDRAALVRAALDRLPRNQRTALVLQHYEGLDLAEIGSLMGISAKAVKSLLHRARTRLREELTDHGLLP